ACGVPLDLDARAFPVGMCTRTVFEKAGIILWRFALHDWRLGVARSFVPYVQAMLAEMARANAIPLTAATTIVKPEAKLAAAAED
ncbi:MAG: hypothetical protein JO326_08760, partial [Acetobacteraceae bacterium]|nr:hypothetical protein [Acetobacteraceae bacterium]